MVNIFILESYMVSVATAQRCLCSAEAAMENKQMEMTMFKQIFFYKKTDHETMGWIWPMGPFAGPCYRKESPLSLWIILAISFHCVFSRQSTIPALPQSIIRPQSTASVEFSINSHLKHLKHGTHVNKWSGNESYSSSQATLADDI